MGQDLDDNGHKKKCKYEITLEELSDLIDSGEVNLVDVREPYELRDNGTIPKAVNIPCKIMYFVIINYFALLSHLNFQFVWSWKLKRVKKVFQP